MSTSGISFGGLASGLDTQAIISALLAVERRPLLQLEQTKKDLQKQKSLFGELDGLLDKINDATRKLKTTSDFLQMKTASSDEALVTASASSSATPGTYSVKVEQLATSQINQAGYSSASTDLAGETGNVRLQIDVGSNTWIIDTAPNLDAIAAEINAQDDLNDIGVRAEVIDTGASNPDPSQRYKLVIRSKEPGSANSFSLSVDSGGTEFTNLVNDLNTNPANVAAADAQLNVNGVTVYRSTNTISDLFEGLTLDLKAADPNKEVTITVSTDATETGATIKKLVDAYNELVDFMEAQNVVDEEGQASSPLFGDTTMRSIRSGLRNIVGGAVTTTGNEAFQLLSQIGITADTKGKLEFSQTKFEEALATDEDAVTALFADETLGIAKRLEDQLKLYTDSVDGLIKTRNDGYDSRIKQTSDRIEQAERRLELYEVQLTQKYANLETLMARLQGQGSSVGNIAQSFG